MSEQPSGRSREQYAGSIRTRPAQSIEPAGQTKPNLSFENFGVAIMGANFLNVTQSLALILVLREASCRLIEPKLPDQYVQHREWSLLCVVEEATEKAYRLQLHGEAQPVVIAPLAVDKLMVGIVQMEIPRQIHRRGFAHIPTVIGALFSGQKLNGHGEDDELRCIAQTIVCTMMVDARAARGLHVAKSWRTVARVGSRFFATESAFHASEPLTMKTKPLDPLIYEFDTEEQAASYDRWFRAQVQAAIDDPRPSVPHDEAMARVRATIQAAKRKQQ